MSDDQGWKPPVFTEGSAGQSGPFVAPGAPAPVYGPAQPAASGYGPSAASGGQPYGASTPAGQPPAAGWTAPPKPGLIPLRPLTLGNILGASFQILRRNPRPTFGFAFAVQSAIMLVTIVIVGLVSFTAISRLATASVDDSEEIAAGAVIITVLSTLIPGILSLVVLALVQGILMLEIQRATLGEKLKLSQLWRLARGRLGALIGWMLLLTVAMLVAIGVLVALIVLLTMLGTVGIALAVVVGIFGGGALMVIAVWLGTKLSLVPSVLMGERPPLREAVARSWSLTNGYFWRTLGIQLLVSTILGFAVQVISVPIQLIAPMTVFLLDPNGTNGPVAVVVIIAVYLLSILVILVASSIALVVQSATTGLIYIDLRMRKEGLDLDLARYVEQTGAGHAARNPYLGDEPAGRRPSLPTARTADAGASSVTGSVGPSSGTGVSSGYAPPQPASPPSDSPWS